ncbi:hypothetical protein MKX01_008834 [Papaver californicum]|nr:hypothetical protein MKX01_008834 [Papaver californicum]
MDMDDAWEALDVDDSDLVSLLRPSTFLSCKHPLFPPPKQNPTKNKKKLPFTLFNHGDNDPDFKRNAWLCAVEFDMGFEAAKSNLSSIKKCLTNKRVSSVIAMVKSCKPNGLGDRILTLKDPSGTIGANVHWKLQKASCCILAFRTGHYLNITLPNLVISKDYSGPPTQGFSVSMVNYACPIDECNKTRSEMAEKVSFARSGATERFTSVAPRQYTNKELLVDDDDDNRRQLEESRAARGNSQRGSSYEPAAERNSIDGAFSNKSSYTVNS